MKRVMLEKGGNYCVYGLLRPTTKLIFWVGMTANLKSRLRAHRHQWRDEIGPYIPFVIFGEGLWSDDAVTLETTLIDIIGRHPDGPLLNAIRGGSGYGEKSHVIHNPEAEMARRAR